MNPHDKYIADWNRKVKLSQSRSNSDLKTEDVTFLKAPVFESILLRFWIAEALRELLHY